MTHLPGSVKNLISQSVNCSSLDLCLFRDTLLSKILIFGILVKSDLRVFMPATKFSENHKEKKKQLHVTMAYDLNLLFAKVPFMGL